MGQVLDIFRGDAFNLVNMTLAMEKLPYVPSRLDKLGLFKYEGVSLPTVGIEMQNGKLMLVPTAARGTMPNVGSGRKRKLRSFSIPHIPLNMAVFATEVEGLRAFGTDDQTEPLNKLVNDKLEWAKQQLELTKEYHRIGAIQGRVLDADGTTEIYDFFDEFGVTQQEFEVDVVNDDLKLFALEMQRYVESKLGAAPYQYIHAFCGDTFFDTLLQNEKVADAYAVGQDNSWLMTQQRLPQGSRGFEFATVIWENYRGSVGDVAFIPDEEAIAFPVGVPDMFKCYYGPAEFMETVNTIGKPVYAKQKVMDWDLGIEIHTQTNPLHICTYPDLLMKITMEAASS